MALSGFESLTPRNRRLSSSSFHESPKPALRLDEQRRRLILDIDDRTDEGGRVGDIIEREPGACS